MNELKMKAIWNRLINFCPELYKITIPDNHKELLKCGFKPGDSLNFLANAHTDILDLLEEIQRLEKIVNSTQVGRGPND